MTDTPSPNFLLNELNEQRVALEHAIEQAETMHKVVVDAMRRLAEHGLRRD